MIALAPDLFPVSHGLLDGAVPSPSIPCSLEDRSLFFQKSCYRPATATREWRARVSLELPNRTSCGTVGFGHVREYVCL
jgi:hypothetical protein